MEKIILAQVAFATLCFLEAMHDKTVIDLQNYAHPQYKELSKKWHKRSFYYVLLCSLLLAYVLDCYWITLSLMACRTAVFNPSLNLLRGKDFFYLSDSGLDLKAKKFFGKYAGELLFFLTWIGILFINLVGLKIIKLSYIENQILKLFS